ncbi:hypothetical protein HI113_11295 [Corallococcus exiguus]|uniref:hypothetical protein n=1 Tax=Corallococcus exiguus TaxID=83462 RepID=UPI0014734396|nr:hypothetical protein [Corallococcus exiguus]NNB94485.1 hypothetical protein [Corallococcus exiguus]
MHSLPPPTSAGVEQVQREAFSRMFRQVTKVLSFLSPLPVVMVSLGLIGDTSAWRRWCRMSRAGCCRWWRSPCSRW